jgi:hypothetical protein
VCGKCFPDPSKTPKTFSAKNIFRKMFLAEEIFFQILEYKKFLILKKNIFLDFLFSKKQ